MDAPTHGDLMEAARQEAILLPTRFNKAIIDVEGSDVNVAFAASASMGEEVARYFAVRMNGLSLSTARGEDLDRWVYDRYQLTRFGSMTAAVVLELSRAGVGAVTIPAGSSFSTEGGSTFRTITDLVFGPNVLGPLTIRAEADKTGVQGNVPAGSVVRATSALEDSTIAVSNPLPAAGGREVETDDELRDRARRFFVTARRGTLSAIEFGALQAARVVQASAVELQDPGTGELKYRVVLNIADVNGQGNAALADDVLEVLQEYRGAGVPVSVVPAIPQYIDIVVVGLQFVAGSATAKLLQQARNAVLTLVNTLPPGATLRKNSIQKALGQVDGVIVPDGAIQEPVGDVVPSTGTCIRTTTSKVILNP